MCVFSTQGARHRTASLMHFFHLCKNVTLLTMFSSNMVRSKQYQKLGSKSITTKQKQILEKEIC